MPKPNGGGFNETNTNLGALLKSMVEGMIVQDSTGKIIEFNQAALDILGLTEDQLTELSLIDSARQDKTFPGKAHAGMKSLQTGEIQRNLVLSIFKQDGEMRWISLNAVPIFNADKNKAVQLINTFTDITDIKRALNELKQVELLFNITHDLMIIANQEGYFKRINPRFSEILGYKLIDIIAQKFSHFVHPDDLELTQTKLNKIFENKKTIHFINRYKTKNGDYRIFDWVIVPDLETNLIYFTARDITDYKTEELAYIRSSKVYSIGEITSGIAYLIHTELAVINCHISFIQDQIEEGQIDLGELKNKIQAIEESIQKLSKTTKELTSFSKTTENEQVSEVPLAKIIDSVLGLSRERFRIHGVKLSVQLEENLILRCRESQMEHVLITLLNNAYNKVHSQRESWVVLNAMIQGDKIKISISDSSPKPREQSLKNSLIPRGLIEENFGSFYFDQTNTHSKLVLEFPLVKKNLDEDS